MARSAMKIDLKGSGMLESGAPVHPGDVGDLGEGNELTSLRAEVLNGVGKLTKDEFADFWSEEGHDEIGNMAEAKEFLDGVKSLPLMRVFKEDLSEFVETIKNDAETEEGEGDGDSEGEESDEGSGEGEADDGEGEGEGEDGEGEGDEEGDEDGEGEGDDEDGEGEDEPSDEEGEGNPDADSEEENKANGADDDLLHRVQELERWRKDEIDPRMEGDLPEPKDAAPKAEAPKNDVKPAPKDAPDMGWLPPEQLLKLMKGGKKADAPKAGSEEILPEWFDKAIQLIKGGKPLFLAGPAGCGKTHTCAIIARYLGLPFGAHSCSEGMHSGDLAGMLLPVEAGGNFVHVPSLFISMCVKPGIFLWDELDNADANFLVGFNMMVAQRELYIPSRRLSTLPEFEVADVLEYWSKHFGAKACEERIGRETIKNLRDLREMLGKDNYAKLDDSFGKVTLHPDFHIIAAANTFGHGANAVYAGRNQLDGSTLDRFRIGTLKLTYSPKVEAALLSEDVRRWAHYLREALAHLRMDRKLVTTRFLKDCSDMEREFGWCESDFAEQFFADFPSVDAEKVAKRMHETITADLMAGKKVV